MGLVTKRQDTLDRLFENFAIDPKKPVEKPKDAKKADSEAKDDQATKK